MYISHLHTGALKAGWSVPELPHNCESSCIFGVTLLKDTSHDGFTANIDYCSHAALLKRCMKKLAGHLNLQQQA